MCHVNTPQKEVDGTKDAFISYHITTDTDFPSFQTPHLTVRRRFTDFVFLFKSLSRDYPACAVPPLPEKHKMEYVRVRGDRFGSDFTARRAYSLDRFLGRLTLHPQLRRAPLLMIFLESGDWNAHMRLRPQRGLSVSDPTSGNGAGVLDSFTDTFLNAFSKVHKPDKRFLEVRDHAEKLEDDLGQVEKVIARVARRQGELELDYADLAVQLQKLIPLEPGVEPELHSFSRSVDRTSNGLRTLKESIDQNYLGSLRDMSAYVQSIKGLLKTREQKQLDFEALTDYLAKASSERDSLASSHGSSSFSGPGGFLRSKIEDVRGVDHEKSRRERLRKLELRIEVLTREVEEAKRTTEGFDEEVVKEVADYDRIKAAEFKSCLGGLADSHKEFYQATIAEWESFVKELENEDQKDRSLATGIAA